MKKIILFIILALPLFTFAQSPRVFTAKCNIAQSGSGSGYWQVAVTGLNDPGGLDATEIQTNDKLLFNDGGIQYTLNITTVISAVGASATIRVSNVGVTEISSVPTTAAVISRGTANYDFVPSPANISANDVQLLQEKTMYDIDSLLQLKDPSSTNELTAYTAAGTPPISPKQGDRWAGYTGDSIFIYNSGSWVFDAARVASGTASDTAIFKVATFNLYNVTRGSGHPNVTGILDSVLTVNGTFGSTTLVVTGGTASAFANTSFTGVIYDGSVYNSYSVISVVGDTITLAEPLKSTVTAGTFKCMHDAAGGYHLTDYGYRCFADELFNYVRYDLAYEANDKIVFLGDSWTQNTALEGKSLTKRFKVDVANVGGDSSLVINNGRGGMTSAWGRYWLDSLVIQQHPKYAIIEFFINDYRSTYSDSSLFAFSATNPGAGGSVVGSTNLRQWRENIEYMARTCIQNNIIPIIITPGNVANISMNNMLINAYLPKLPNQENTTKVSSQWVPAVGGIKYNLGKVQIGTYNTDPNADLAVIGSSTTTGACASFRTSSLSPLFYINNDGRLSVGGTGTTGYRLAVAGSSSFSTTFGVIRNGGGGSFLISNTGLIQHFSTLSATSGSSNNLIWFVGSAGTGFSSASGSPTFNVISMQHHINMSGTSTAISRGVFYDPIIDGSTGLTHRAWENTTGNMIFGSTSGNVGVGLTGPTARVQIAAGTATAGTAPLKFTSGALLTTPEVGAFGFLTDKLYFTITTGAARKEITLNDATLTSGRIPVSTTNGRLNDFAGLSYSSSTGLAVSGTTTNDNASTGNVGEYISSLIASGSAVSLTTATAANVASISLTAGDWDVEGWVNYDYGSATVTQSKAGINTTSATIPSDGSEAYSATQLTLTSSLETISLTRKRISIASTTTVYLVGQATFSAGTTSAFGGITARRVR